VRLYVYGVTAPEASVPAGLSGVGGPSAVVRLVPVGPLVAVVSEAPAAVRARRRDVMAHQRVLAEIGRTAPALPTRFGMIAQDEQALRATLEAEIDANLAALERVRGRVEMNLKIGVAESGLSQLLRESRSIRLLHEEVGRSPGYAAKIRLGQAVADGLRQRAAAAAEVVLRRVSEVAEDGAEGPEADGCVANVSFLIASEQVEAVRTLVANLASEVGPRAELRLTGPLPCYSFCTQPSAATAAV
jgi:hypothetical protein